jgi:hypothetical protein
MRVKSERLSSDREATRELAKTPSLFAFISHEEKDYVFIPSVSSEAREYIPLGFLSKKVIASNLGLIIPGASLFHFGVLTSAMHMAWVRFVCGRLESRYRYSNGIVYNNYPWPKAATGSQVSKVEECAQTVLDARANNKGLVMAKLYDPVLMPPDLRAAHTALDRAVDQCYRKEKFGTELERIQFLFELYRQYTAPLLPAEKALKAKRGRKAKAT